MCIYGDCQNLPEILNMAHVGQDNDYQYRFEVHFWHLVHGTIIFEDFTGHPEKRA